MTTANTAPPSAHEEIRLGMANACLMLPRESERRRAEIERLHHLRDREKEAVREARDDVDVKGHENRLSKVYGVTKATVQIMKILEGVKKPGDRAAVLTQVGLLSQDVGYLDKDLVSLAQDAAASAGSQADDQGSVFDKTSEGQRRGGAKAQPKPVSTKAAAPVPKPTAGIPLHEARAQLEAYLKDNPPKRGAKPAERKRLEAQVEAAQAAEQSGAGTAEPDAAAGESDGEQAGPTITNAADDEFDVDEAQDEGEADEGSEYADDATDAEPREAEAGEVSRTIKEGTAQADAVLREQIRQSQAPAPAAPPVAPTRRPSDDLDDELPPPAPRRATKANGSYTLVN